MSGPPAPPPTMDPRMRYMVLCVITNVAIVLLLMVFLLLDGTYSVCKNYTDLTISYAPVNFKMGAGRISSNILFQVYLV